MLAAGGAAIAHWRDRNVSPVQRGYQVAVAHGCFGCHGPGGRGGVEGIPSFTAEDLDGYVETDDEIREWIRDGRPRRLAVEADAGEALVPMPAFAGILSETEIDDVTAYVRAVGERQRPPDGPAAAGRAAAERLGCFGCHGPQGRGSLPNPGSLKGYIPAWDGPDFADLVRSDAEVAEWVVDGRPRRLHADRMARFFLDRQVIQMPAYGDRITPEDLDAIVHYLRWLRAGRDDSN